MTRFTTLGLLISLSSCFDYGSGGGGPIGSRADGGPPDAGPPTPVDRETASTGMFDVGAPGAFHFFQADAGATFELSGAQFAQNPTNVLLVHNGRLLDPSEFELSAQRLAMKAPLLEGPNSITVTALDTVDGQIALSTTLWAGSRTLTVQTRDSTGQPVVATVKVALGDDQRVSAQAASTGGQVAFLNVPDRTMIVTAQTSDNHYAATAATGSMGTILLQLTGIAPPSTTANNEFTMGTSGWQASNAATVTVAPHKENAAGPPGSDQDLTLATKGEGPVSVTRTFKVDPATKAINVRYRFVTSEVPGGYFGTKYNDFFNVAIRTLGAGGLASESNSMNGLGLGAFDAAGNTAWKDLTLPISTMNETVQVDVTVANVADDLYDSSITIDLVEEKGLSVETLQLQDIDGTPLELLSCADHPYFNGNTRVHGTIRISGAKDDALTSVELEIIQGGQPIAKGSLAQGVRMALLKPFGMAGRLELNSSQLLFEIPATEAKKVDVSKNGTVTLRVLAKSMKGESASKEGPKVDILDRYAKTNRYPTVPRDEMEGGDDWVLPEVKPVIEHFESSFLVNDFSNMNGGEFKPHQLHRRGVDVDAWFDGYNDLDGDTAISLLELLRDQTYGDRIIVIYVDTVSTQASFWQALDGVMIAGKPARNRFQQRPSHGGHFHLMLTPK